MPEKEKILSFPVHPGVTPLDLVGPLTILRNIGRTPYRTVVVGERTEELARVWRTREPTARSRR
jgi:hypothetical protein